MPKITFQCLLLAICGFGLVPLSIYQGTNIFLHLFFTTAIVQIFGLLLWALSPNTNELSVWLRKYVLAAIFARVFLLNIVLLVSYLYGHSVHGFFDDEFYEQAWQLGNTVDQRNAYVTMAVNIGQLFGDYTPVILRETNIVLSALTAFPALLVLQRFGVSEWGIKISLLLLLFSPYPLAHSLFAIKDFITAFLLVIAILQIVEIASAPATVENGHRFLVVRILVLVGLCLLLEEMRRGQGLVTISALLVTMILWPRIHVPAMLKLLLFVLLLVSVVAWLHWYGDAYFVHAARYIQWIGTQVAKEDFRSFLIIDSLTEIWKIPISFAAYLLGPLPQPGQTGRILIDAGGWLKFFDLPVLIFILFGFWRVNPVALTPLALMVLLPLLLSSVWNVSNFRAQLAYYPSLYIMFAFLLDQEPNRVRSGLKMSCAAAVFVAGGVLVKVS
jgi:hypothetical protein